MYAIDRKALGIADADGGRAIPAWIDFEAMPAADGKLSLDDQLSRFVPRALTIRRLLHHASVMPEHEAPMPSLTRRRRCCKRQACDFRRAYCNAGYMPPGQVIERAS